MKKIASVIGLSLALSIGSVAQAATMDSATATAVNELLVAMKYQETLKLTMQAMAQQIPAGMLDGATAAINGNPKLSAEQKTVELDKVKREIPRIAEAIGGVINDPALAREIGAEMGPLLVRHFTLDEIRQMTALYRSPLGAKMLTQMPAVMNESMQIGQRVMAPRIQALVQQVRSK